MFYNNLQGSKYCWTNKHVKILDNHIIMKTAYADELINGHMYNCLMETVEGQKLIIDLFEYLRGKVVPVNLNIGDKGFYDNDDLKIVLKKMDEIFRLYNLEKENKRKDFINKMFK